MLGYGSVLSDDGEYSHRVDEVAPRFANTDDMMVGVVAGKRMCGRRETEGKI